MLPNVVTSLPLYKTTANNSSFVHHLNPQLSLQPYPSSIAYNQSNHTVSILADNLPRQKSTFQNTNDNDCYDFHEQQSYQDCRPMYESAPCSSSSPSVPSTSCNEATLTLATTPINVSAADVKDSARKQPFLKFGVRAILEKDENKTSNYSCSDKAIISEQTLNKIIIDTRIF